ncbi:hypothetical protein NEOLEDRAFT_1151244 [Neolentinus lepideus HHB14362 ss-1]|uniref:F-box domain-containing protein n=1 Tax=Neolentinus lepideus HHB14362 ss-1 TaxID=1314782 RepID=A0A165P5S4_9AGAM|nr:hypothetical protein NEOLEDRAFT_1151244 [Neolentinus lepideus HHB14362 ss-1]
MRPGHLVHTLLRRFAKISVDSGQDALPPEIFGIILKHSAPSLPEVDETAYQEYPGSTARVAQRKAQVHEQQWFSSLLLVCSRWYEMGTPLLYHQVHVSSYDQLRKFSRTLERHPEYGTFVRWLFLPHHTSILWCIARPFKANRSGYTYHNDLAVVFCTCRSLRQLELEPPAYFDPPLPWLSEDTKGYLNISNFPAPRGIWPEEFTELKSLTLHGEFITAAFLGYPGELPSLEELCLIGTNSLTHPAKNFMMLGASDVQFQLPKLRTLRLRRCIFKRGWLHQLSVPRLQTLEITDCQIQFRDADDDSSRPTLLPLGALKTVQMPVYPRLLWSSFSDFHNLQHLIVLLDPQGPISLPAGIAEPPQLVHLELVLMEITPGEDLSILATTRSKGNMEEVIWDLYHLLDRGHTFPLLRRLVIRGDLDEENHWVPMKQVAKSCAARGIEFAWHGQYAPWLAPKPQLPLTLEERLERRLHILQD